nr:uncharacterized protein LOC107457475 isoform X2 [Parasteatoda tepidariorum]
MGASYICKIIFVFFSLTVTAVRTEKRTLSCDNICKGIRFPGKLGGCNCNYVIFTKRSSQLRSLETEVENLEELRQKLFGKIDTNENTEYETLDEKDVNHLEFPRNFIDILKKRIGRPIMRNLDY